VGYVSGFQGFNFLETELETKVLRFLGIEVLRIQVQDFGVLGNQSFAVSRFRGFLVSSSRFRGFKIQGVRDFKVKTVKTVESLKPKISKLQNS
jgi:hypothetical protein